MSVHVVICGGGIGGIAAALAASRNGAKTTLIEKQCVLGGLATSGLISIYLPLDDGEGNQISYGISEELIRLSMKHGCQDKYPRPWLEGGTKKEKSQIRFKAQYNPVWFALECEQLLLQNHVEILYDTRVICVHMEENHIKSIGIVNDEGIKTVNGDAFVDASGNASLFTMSKSETKGPIEKNVPAGWYYSSEKKGLQLRMLGIVDDMPCNGGHGYAVYNGISDITEFLLTSHKMMINDMQKQKGEPACISMMPDLRIIRRIQSARDIYKKDEGMHIASSIGMVSDWRKRGPRYEVPYECLFASKVNNLYACGRITGSDDAMWDIMRVMPCCAVTGQAAGVAASLSDKRRPSAAEVQQALHDQGQKLFFSDIQ